MFILGGVGCHSRKGLHIGLNELRISRMGKGGPGGLSALCFLFFVFGGSGFSRMEAEGRSGQRALRNDLQVMASQPGWAGFLLCSVE